ncbi:DNA methylase N-4/N-6 [Nitrobacter hamburgensis X14]|uniref:Methyltransferase n=1 Tax=Nitrobacter hamburgensis (strain DSM 10229 / NCIMB 13809 / X14) TaxID=323097 RepID=Q1QQN8_NITHX|nr:DNA methyltransferase [Nitrobacter hamburgensis]ABE61459.1 DNA methylase N-4/N-6 [Nitrobacter hamburgensis X14]
MTFSTNQLRNSIQRGDCIEVMQAIPSRSVDFILTDPPYLVRYKCRDGRSIMNDDNAEWLEPAAHEMYRVLNRDSLCVSFYGWTQTDRFIAAWRSAGFRIVGHIVFRKRYASAKRFVSYTHESAYVLAKGRPALPEHPPADVIDFPYSGNRLHPTQKPVMALMPLITAFCPEGGLVLDPFCGSGSTLVAARQAGCDYLGIELDHRYHRIAARRLAA